jgi:16S rRNA (cytosine967-C5)-methyltransferase
MYDAILCDAPCSGLGVLARVPDIKYRRTEADVMANGRMQAKLLENLAGFVKPGGRVVYSVCTFEPEETDGVVEVFLKKRPDFVLEGAGGYVPEESAALVDGQGFLRIYPHRHRADGFFAARLKRVS